MSILLATLALATAPALVEPAPAAAPLVLAQATVSCSTEDGAGNDASSCAIAPERRSRDDLMPSPAGRKQHRKQS